MRRVNRQIHSTAALAGLTTHRRENTTAQHHPQPAATASEFYICGLTGRRVPAVEWDAHSSDIDFRVRSMVANRFSGEVGPRQESKHAVVEEASETAGTSDVSGSAAGAKTTGGAQPQQGSTVAGGGSSSSSGSTFSWAANAAKARAIETPAVAGKAGESSTSTTAASSSSSSAKPRPPMYHHLRNLATKPLGPLPYNKLWSSVSRNVRLVQEFNLAKRSRRLGRVNIALKFLRDHHVIMHSPLRWCPSPEVPAAEKAEAPKNVDSFRASGRQAKGATPAAASTTMAQPQTAAAKATKLTPEEKKAAFLRGARAGQWNVSQPFHRLLLNGESLLKSEVNVRLLKFFPKMDDPEAYNELMHRCLCNKSLAKLFDDAQIGRIIERKGRRAQPLSEYQKASMFSAMLCELFWFCERTKANDRTHNNALFPPSDVLILHVLAAHVVETLYSEVVFAQIEPIAEQIRSQAWPRFSDQQVDQIVKFTPKTPSALALSEIARCFVEGTDGLRVLVPGGKGKAPVVEAPKDDDAESVDAAAPASASAAETSSATTVDTAESMLDKFVQNAVAAAKDTEISKYSKVMKAQRRAEEALETLKGRLETATTDGHVPREATSSSSSTSTEEEAAGGESNTAEDGVATTTTTKKREKKPYRIDLTKAQIEAAIANAERKLANMQRWVAHYEKRVEGLEASIRKQMLARSKRASEEITLAQKKVAAGSSAAIADDDAQAKLLAIAKPLLHDAPFHRDTIVTVQQSDALLNYKKYRRMEVDAKDRSTFMSAENGIAASTPTTAGRLSATPTPRGAATPNTAAGAPKLADVIAALEQKKASA